mgnify:CR=1 FL=1
MMTRRRTTAAMIARAIEAARAAGLPVAAVEVQTGGTVRIVAGTPEAAQDGGSAYDRWRASRARASAGGGDGPKAAG